MFEILTVSLSKRFQRQIFGSDKCHASIALITCAPRRIANAHGGGEVTGVGSIVGSTWCFLLRAARRRRDARSPSRARRTRAPGADVSRVSPPPRANHEGQQRGRATRFASVRRAALGGSGTARRVRVRQGRHRGRPREDARRRARGRRAPGNGPRRRVRPRAESTIRRSRNRRFDVRPASRSRRGGRRDARLSRARCPPRQHPRRRRGTDPATTTTTTTGGTSSRRRA